mmetsp:Transcript_8944/g.28280  ORF Transcript_8944/g.28280 Transcript_8944/m.28280 type:complete len:240 (-) Transcript_8944:161-880(-)
MRRLRASLAEPGGDGGKVLRQHAVPSVVGGVQCAGRRKAGGVVLGQGEGLDRVIAGPEEADRHLPHLKMSSDLPSGTLPRSPLDERMNECSARPHLLQQRHVRERRRNQHEGNDHRPVRRRKRDRLAAAPALPHDDGARRAAVVLGPDDVTHDLRHVLAGHRAWLGELVRVQVRDNDAPTGTREESRRRNPLGDHVGIRALALQRDDEWRASRAELECIDATEVGGEFQRDGLAGCRGH